MTATRRTQILIALAALLTGAVATWLIGRSAWRAQPPPAADAIEPPAAVTKIAPAPATAVLMPGEEVLEAAKVKAREARAAGTLKPAATTADEFARALGAINYRIHELSLRQNETPAESPADREAHNALLDQITADLANLLLDEHLADAATDDTPGKLARHQAMLAAGSLDLDDATAARIEQILLKAYAAAMPAGAVPELAAEQERQLDEKLAALTDTVIPGITALLTPEQKARFDSMGAAQVLFGLLDAAE